VEVHHEIDFFVSSKKKKKKKKKKEVRHVLKGLSRVVVELNVVLKGYQRVVERLAVVHVQEVAVVATIVVMAIVVQAIAVLRGGSAVALRKANAAPASVAEPSVVWTNLLHVVRDGVACKGKCAVVVSAETVVQVRSKKPHN